VVIQNKEATRNSPVDQQRHDKVDDGDNRISFTLSDIVNRILAEGDQASSLGRQLSASLKTSDKELKQTFDDAEVIELLGNYSLTQIFALRQVCCQLASALDLLTIGSARSNKTTRLKTDGPYRPRN
jgi:hypothetical protein